MASNGDENTEGDRSYIQFWKDIDTTFKKVSLDSYNLELPNFSQRQNSIFFQNSYIS